MRGREGRVGNRVKGKKESSGAGERGEEGPDGRRGDKRDRCRTDGGLGGEEWKRLTGPQTEPEYENYSSQGK